MPIEVNPSLTSARFRELAGANPPCITIAIQSGGNVRARLKDAIRQVEAEMKSLPPATEREILEHIEEIASRLDTEPQRSWIIYVSKDYQRAFSSESPLAEATVVNDEFQLRSLLPLTRNRADFYVLALSQTHPRLLHCTESESGEVALPADVPKSYAQSRETRKPDHVLDNRATGGPSTGSMKGVMFGTTSEKEDKDEFLLNFYRMLDRGVNTILGGSGVPLIAVAVEHEIALYRSINTYPALLEPGVRGAPDGLKGGEMHKRALELFHSRPSFAIEKDLQHFEKLAGTGHASSHAQQIVRAAYEGRVSKIFYEPTAEYRGTFDEVRRKVKRHGDGSEPMRDLLNEAIIQTLRHGGEAVVLTSKQMPNGVPFCAIFRYADPEFQTPHTETAGTAV